MGEGVQRGIDRSGVGVFACQLQRKMQRDASAKCKCPLQKCQMPGAADFKTSSRLHTGELGRTCGVVHAACGILGGGREMRGLGTIRKDATLRLCVAMLRHAMLCCATLSAMLALRPVQP